MTMTREEAINMIKVVRQYLTAGNPIFDAKKINETMRMAIEALSERTGEWIYSTKQLEIVPMWECSCCRIRAAKKFNFCPHCGADMRGEQDGNV